MRPAEKQGEHFGKLHTNNRNQGGELMPALPICNSI